MNKLWILWLVCPFGIALPIVVITGLSKGGRTWCNYMCPWGTIGVTFGNEQLQVTKDCTDCKKCLDVCPQSEVIEPVVNKGGVIDKNCLVCLRCVDVCSTGAITFIERK